MGYAADKLPQSEEQWRCLLAEVLTDAGMVLDEDDNEDAIRWVIGDLSKKGVLLPPVPTIEVGSMVLALLVEDDDWHQAVVESDLGNGTVRVLFLEYGKPQDTLADHIRSQDTIVD